MKTILFLASNPITDAQLRLAREVQDSIDAIKQAIDGDRFRIEIRLALRPKDLQPTLLKVRPRIVHFCGHGEENGLFLENDAGEPHLVDKEALADLFRLFSDRIECVILNACSTKSQAEAVAKHINYVIGMNQPILDRSAIAFSKGFYGALGAGESITQAYNLGCNRIRLEFGEITSTRKAVVQTTGTQNTLPVKEHLIPILFTNKNPRTIELTDASSQAKPTGDRAASGTLTPFKRRRLEQELEDLQQPYDLLREKLKRLRARRAYENDPLTELKLDEQIKEAEEAINKIVIRIEAIERKLNYLIC